MHGQQNIKICNAEQAKHLHRYKNIKTKLYKCNATTWYRGKKIAVIVRKQKISVSS